MYGCIGNDLAERRHTAVEPCFKCRIELVYVLCRGLHRRFHRLLEMPIHRNAQPLQRGFRDGHGTLEVVLHGVCHRLRRTVGILYGFGQCVEILIACIDDRKQAGHAFLPGDRSRILRLLVFRETFEALAHIEHDFAEGLHVALTIRQRYAEVFHRGFHFVGRLCKARERLPQGRARLAALDAAVRHQADRNGGIFHAVPECTGNRRDVFKCFAHHADVGIRFARSLRQHVRKVSGFVCGKPERRHGVRHDV